MFHFWNHDSLIRRRTFNIWFLWAPTFPNGCSADQEAVSPMLFVTLFRQNYPQFDQVVNGMHAQQGMESRPCEGHKALLHNLLCDGTLQKSWVPRAFYSPPSKHCSEVQRCPNNPFYQVCLKLKSWCCFFFGNSPSYRFPNL